MSTRTDGEFYAEWQIASPNNCTALAVYLNFLPSVFVDRSSGEISEFYRRVNPAG